MMYNWGTLICLIHWFSSTDVCSLSYHLIRPYISVLWKQKKYPWNTSDPVYFDLCIKDDIAFYHADVVIYVVCSNVSDFHRSKNRLFTVYEIRAYDWPELSDCSISKRQRCIFFQLRNIWLNSVYIKEVDNMNFRL